MHSIVTLAVFIAVLPATCALTVVSSRAERAARVLLTEGSTELLQLGNEVRQPDALGKVKEMISHMIVRHQEAQYQDTDHKAFCDKEVAASKNKVEKLKTDLQKRNADQDLHSAQMAQLKDSIGDLHTEIVNAHKDSRKATELRSQEAATYVKNKASWEKTLLDMKRLRRSDIGAERDLARKTEEEIVMKKVHAENAEEDAQFRFKKLDGQFAVAVAKKTKTIEFKERKVVSMTHELSLGDGDFKMAQEEMAAAKEYEVKIKSSCTNRHDPVKERKAAREHQMASLKEAYGILSGDDIPR